MAELRERKRCAGVAEEAVSMKKQRLDEAEERLEDTAAVLAERYKWEQRFDALARLAREAGARHEDILAVRHQPWRAAEAMLEGDAAAERPAAAPEQHNGAVTAAAAEQLAAAATVADQIAVQQVVAQQVAAPLVAAAEQAAVEPRAASLAEIRSVELMAWQRLHLTPECRMQAVAKVLALAASQRAADELTEQVREQREQRRRKKVQRRIALRLAVDNPTDLFSVHCDLMDSCNGWDSDEMEEIYCIKLSGEMDAICHMADIYRTRATQATAA